MTSFPTETCESCGYTAVIADDAVFQEYNGKMLCATCRVNKRLADNDFKDE